MHIPPYHKKGSWQRFFSGMLFGGLLAYFILLYMYGVMYEDLIKENLDMTETVSDLRKQNEALLADQSDGNTPRKVSEIEIIISNQEILKNDSLLVSQLKSLIKREINHLIGAEITIISASDELLIAAIENKAFKIDDVTYHFTISRLTIDSKLKIVAVTSLLN